MDSSASRAIPTTESGKGSAAAAAASVPYFVRWSDDMLSTGIDVGTLPTSARLIIVLSALTTATLEEKRLAVVALPLFDENRCVRGGRWAMRMFHSENSDSDAVRIPTRGSTADDEAGSDHSDDGTASGRPRAGSKLPNNSADSMASKASLTNVFPSHIVCGEFGCRPSCVVGCFCASKQQSTFFVDSVRSLGPYAENEVDDDSPVVMFQLGTTVALLSQCTSQLVVTAVCVCVFGQQNTPSDRYLLPVQSPFPDYDSILTESNAAHAMAIVKLDPSRPSVVSIVTSPVSQPPTPPQPQHSAASMLMVSSTLRTTRRSSMMAASLVDYTAAAKHEELTPVKEAPLIVPVTDTLDKSEVHLLSDILSRGVLESVGV